MNVPEISKLETKWSPEVLVYDIPWKIQITKCNKNDVTWLGVRLNCTKKDFSPDCFYAASSLIKLIPFDEKFNAVEQSLPSHIFSSDAKGWGTIEWIRWDCLFDNNKKYVKNDTIKLDITIKMADPNDENKSDVIFENVYKNCEVGCFSTFRLTVTNIDNLQAVRSPQFMLRSVSCYLEVNKDSQNLGIMLEKFDEIPHKNRILITLVSAQSTKSIQKVIKKGLTSRLILTTWDNLLKPENDFINCNSITIEVDFVVEDSSSDGKIVQSNTRKSVGKIMQCAICLETLEKQDVSSIRCGHIFCTECIKNTLEERRACPLCNNPANLNDLRRSFLPL